MDTRPIVVGVDGSDGSAAAIRHGADRAYASGRGLHLVHVAPVFIPMSGAAPMGTPYLPQDFDTVGKAVLAEAVEYARALMPSERLTSTLTVGSRSSGLLHEARHASEIVFGEDRTPFLERISFGSMVAQVCAHSPVPVTCVPESWRPDRPELVVVGIHDYNHISLELVRAGFAAAQERAAGIEFIHVWDLPPGYGRMVDSVMDFPRWRTMVEHFVAKAVIEAVGHDAGAFDVRAVHGHPSHELQDRSREATLILLGHHRNGGFFDHLGGTGRALLRTSDCPVEVLPVSDPVVPVDVEQHDEFLRA
ncbi:universal stress protein [Nocardioides baekrokdamisoli]|uniref:Universal stress protein n=1 Tax=Nocardioides baekrokdamisoli TaxID=1804624 RepID=A0A3G9J4P5_9ACTN|nr:universal stress protein [Nocardioides baekrokdamisoli]BBH18394.1 universal stress protein [Nocardioides baekrokdamisoli]